MTAMLNDRWERQFVPGVHRQIGVMPLSRMVMPLSRRIHQRVPPPSDRPASSNIWSRRLQTGEALLSLGWPRSAARRRRGRMGELQIVRDEGR